MDKKKILLDSNMNFYKGNMHCHSNLSDGKLSPEELKELFKSHGYSFLAITDHEHINNNSYLDDEDFVTLTSTELAIKEFPEQSTLVNFNMKVCHLNLYAKKQDNNVNICYDPTLDHYTTGEKRASLKKLGGDYSRVYGRDGINEIIRTANENGFFVCYNHPRWSLENYREYSEYEGLWGVEIYNHSCNTGGLYEYDINVLDDFLRDGKRIFASCGDDNHNHRNDVLGAFVMVNAPSLSYENIISALLDGRFYASSGPVIHELYTEGNKVYIKCSDAKRITLSTFGRRAACKSAPEGGYITEAEFEIRESDTYFRIDVIDESGNRANTQAYYLEDI
ncbi:MAG: hypothetical protein J6C82_00850 [Clostridia bacterium]|nr:hypothetical protein [Clostridia bacterium]